MIKIFNVIIDEKQIIGIGPLLIGYFNDTTERSLSFELYTSAYAIRVSTTGSYLNPHYSAISKAVRDSFIDAHRLLKNALVEQNFSGLWVMRIDENDLQGDDVKGQPPTRAGGSTSDNQT